MALAYCGWLLSSLHVVKVFQIGDGSKLEKYRGMFGRPR